MTFSGKAHYPMNVRWCAGCKAYKSNKGCQMHPFRCQECKAKERK